MGAPSRVSTANSSNSSFSTPKIGSNLKWLYTHYTSNLFTRLDLPARSAGTVSSIQNRKPHTSHHPTFSIPHNPQEEIKRPNTRYTNRYIQARNIQTQVTRAKQNFARAIQSISSTPLQRYRCLLKPRQFHFKNTYPNAMRGRYYNTTVAKSVRNDWKKSKHLPASQNSTKRLRRIRAYGCIDSAGESKSSISLKVVHTG